MERSTSDKTGSARPPTTQVRREGELEGKIFASCVMLLYCTCMDEHRPTLCVHVVPGMTGVFVLQNDAGARKWPATKQVVNQIRMHALRGIA